MTTKYTVAALLAALALTTSQLAGAQAPAPPRASIVASAPEIAGPDPLVSDPVALAIRSEVQYEIDLNLNQRDTVQDAINAAAAPFQQQIQRFEMQASRRRLTPQQQRETMAQIEVLQRAGQSAVDSATKQALQKVLTPKQMARLDQLDLQWRGPMSLADPKVAQLAKLSPEHKAAVAKIESDYSQQSRQLVADAIRQQREQAQQNGGQVQQAAVLDLASPYSQIRQKLVKMRKEAEDKTLATLTPDETAGWQAAIGKPFKFRAS